MNGLNEDLFATTTMSVTISTKSFTSTKSLTCAKSLSSTKRLSSSGDRSLAGLSGCAHRRAHGHELSLSRRRAPPLRSNTGQRPWRASSRRIRHPACEARDQTSDVHVEGHEDAHRIAGQTQDKRRLLARPHRKEPNSLRASRLLSDMMETPSICESTSHHLESSLGDSTSGNDEISFRSAIHEPSELFGIVTTQESPHHVRPGLACKRRHHQAIRIVNTTRAQGLARGARGGDFPV